MRILWVRHGESEGNTNQALHAAKGDCDIALTPRGWQQAIAAGRYLGQYYKTTETGRPPRIYVSSYRRPKETLSGILAGMGDDVFAMKPPVYEESLLIEKNFGAMAKLHEMAKNKWSVKGVLSRWFMAVSKEAYKNDPFTVRTPMGESTKDMFLAYKLFEDKLFRAVRGGHPDILVVAHGAFIKAALMSWGHLKMEDERIFPNPGNCDIIKIEGIHKDWTLRRIYDGAAMRAVDEDALHGFKPFTLDDLPPVPEGME